MRKISFSIVLACLLQYPLLLTAQSFAHRLSQLYKKLENIKATEQETLAQIEELKLAETRKNLKEFGLPRMAPGEELIEHAALFLVYSEEHEQAKWVAHLILPDIIEGAVLRSNDFRPDPKVKTGTAVEKDYFLKFLQPDSTFKYDGYGYDRGHLAPSADFRWSEKALSESYFYSNMSPQLPDFNREIWADLENEIRGYIYRNPESKLYVVTGPVLDRELPKVARSTNGVSIPQFFWKVVLDLEQHQAVGFVIPHRAIDYPLSKYAMPIDRVEELTGIDFFHRLPDDLEERLESRTEKALWLPEVNSGNVEPIDPLSLPNNAINTVIAQKWMGEAKEINVCGTVVSARTSRSGNILLNLDKQFPDQVFTVFIRKEHILNFGYNPEKQLMGKKICAFGKVIGLSGVPAMFIEGERAIEIWQE